ncbi:alpha/beta hydrolase [Chitinophaga defluvii]|uniref:Alpha/beta hydrolase n=1 Tax=Chitinophaga defluvii TaxID=3163343 RepID=A0ABV2TET7_9BACT
MGSYRTINKLLLLLLIVGGFFVGGCQKNETSTILPASREVEVKDEAYGTDPAQKMDVYLPADRSTDATKAIVFIHGGGWVGGDKKDFTLAIDSLKNRTATYAYFNINYRLATANRNHFPTAEQDVKQALEYIWQNAGRYQISNITIVLGASAGAHLAALSAYKHNEKGYIKTAICLIGVYNMTTLYNQAGADVKPLLSIFMGGSPQQNPTAYQEGSPVNYVTAKSPPTLVIHGTEDQVAPIAQAEELVQHLKQAGVVHEYVTYKAGHEIPPASAGDAVLRMFTFINKYAK